MMGVEYTGTRYDMGNKFGILQAIVEVALQHPQVKINLGNTINHRWRPL